MAGERDAALAWLGELLATPSLYTPAYLRVHPTWARLRGDPRFEALLAARRPPVLIGALRSRAAATGGKAASLVRVRGSRASTPLGAGIV
ncbi:MAG: hypothetical protein LC798_08205 [Chloroflexi bacterium]|nr:hypothetical protein [Chloroflexota bacterium]